MASCSPRTTGSAPHEVAEADCLHLSATAVALLRLKYRVVRRRAALLVFEIQRHLTAGNTAAGEGGEQRDQISDARVHAPDTSGITADDVGPRPFRRAGIVVVVPRGMRALGRGRRPAKRATARTRGQRSSGLSAPRRAPPVRRDSAWQRTHRCRRRAANSGRTRRDHPRPGRQRG